MKKQIAAVFAVILLFLLSFNTGVYAAESYSFVNAPAKADIGQTVNFAVTDGEQTFNCSDFIWSVSPSDSAIVYNGSVTFVNSGNVTVKATNASGTAQTVVSVSRTPYTEDGALVYNFNTGLAMNRFDANFVPDDKGVGAGNEDWKNHWSLDNDKGYVERINDFDPDVSSNVTSLYFKNTKMCYFDVTVIYQSVTGAGGWIGIVSNKTDLAKRGIDEGLASFVQSAGQPTFWGPIVGGGPREIKHTEFAAIGRENYYAPTAWHVLRVRMLQNQVEMYIDDLQHPIYTYYINETPSEGNLGVMASGTGFRIKHIRASYIESDGTKIPYHKVDTLTVAQAPTSCTVGQTIDLSENILIAPDNATIKGYSMMSSDSNVCIAKNGKLVFIAQGEVTVSIVSNDNPSVLYEWIIQVTGDPELGEPGSGSYYVNKDRPNIGGMLLTIAFSVITLAGVGGIVALLLVKKKH